MRDLDVPRFATAGVIEVARRDDASKEEILRPMFGDEWAGERAFSDSPVADRETIELDDISLTVTDLGAGESPHESLWTLEGQDTVFSADLAYSLAARLRGDGARRQARGGLGLPEPAKATVLDAARDYLPPGNLEFLLELRLDPLADKLGVR